MSQPRKGIIARRTIGHVVALALMGVTPALAAPAAPADPLPEPLPPTSIVEAVAPVPAPPPPPAAPAAPVTAAPLKLLEADVGTRLGLRIQSSNPNKPDKLNDLGMDGQVQVLLSGQATRHILWQADFVGTFGNQVGGTDTSDSAAVLDLIGRFEFHDAFNLWVGRMLVPADRSGLSTEWSIAPWLFPGQFVAGQPPVGALQGPHGRSDGVTLWGQFGGGTFKYFAGAFNLADPKQSPLYSARLSLSLLNPEPGYRNASTYYGSKDVLALGAGFQYQHNGWAENYAATPPGPWADFTELNFDLFFEKNLGAGGVMDLEGAFYKIWGQYTPESVNYFVLASYLLPIEVGPGKFQPLFRLQQAHDRATDDTDALADAQLGYIIDGLRARVALDYRYSKVQGQTGNAILLGLQLMTK
jgi:hypothetical protein